MQCACRHPAGSRTGGARRGRYHRHVSVRQRGKVFERALLGRGMIRIEAEPWAEMVAHARKTYPNECCGAMLGSADNETKLVRAAMPLENAFAGAQAARYELRPED